MNTEIPFLIQPGSLRGTHATPLSTPVSPVLAGNFPSATFVRVPEFKPGSPGRDVDSDIPPDPPPETRETGARPQQRTDTSGQNSTSVTQVDSGGPDYKIACIGQGVNGAVASPTDLPEQKDVSCRAELSAEKPCVSEAGTAGEVNVGSWEVSFFHQVASNDADGLITIDSIVSGLRDPEPPAAVVEVRSLMAAWAMETNPEERERLERLKREKKAAELPVVCFAGQMVGRSLPAGNHNGLVTIDLDHLLDAEARRDEIFEREENCVLAMVSPSGDGVKLVFLTNCTKEFHEAAFHGIAGHLKTRYGVDADPSGKDVVRLCFLGWDPELRYRPVLRRLDVSKLPPVGNEGRMSSSSTRHERPRPSVLQEASGTSLSSDAVLGLLLRVKPRPDYANWIKVIAAVGAVLPWEEAIAVLKIWSPEERCGEYAEKLASGLNKCGIHTLEKMAHRDASSLRGNWPKLDRGTADEIAGLAARLGLDCPPLKSARNGLNTLWFGDHEGSRCWAISDPRNMALRLLRLDGQPWRRQEHLGLPLSGSDLDWPPGLGADSPMCMQSDTVLLTAGEEDYLCALQIILETGRLDVLPACCLRRDMHLGPAAISAIARRDCIIWSDGSASGNSAARSLARRLAASGIRAEAKDPGPAGVRGWVLSRPSLEQMAASLQLSGKEVQQ